MSLPEPRAGLRGGKVVRPHPAEPLAPAGPTTSSAQGDEGLVMFCVRVTPALRRRLKLASAFSGVSLQALAAAALEAVCREHDM